MYDADWKREDFLAWVTAKKPNDVVGTSANCEQCPLARWRAALGERVSVEDSFVELPSEVSLTKIKIPEWASKFVTGIDAYYRDVHGGYNEEPVKASACIEVLDTIA